MSQRPLFGAILAGGQNRRYGSPKALVQIGGERIIERVRRALRTVTPDVVLIANDTEPYAALGLPMRGDAHTGVGALGGLHSALCWAHDERRAGVLAAACDMPFLSAPLLARILAESDGADVVAPESGGRRGVEPLCAFYSTNCLAAIEAQLARGDHHMIGFYDDVVVRRIPLAEVRQFGAPDVLFLNVNTHEDRLRAELLAAAS